MVHTVDLGIQNSNLDPKMTTIKIFVVSYNPTMQMRWYFKTDQGYFKSLPVLPSPSGLHSLKNGKMTVNDKIGRNWKEIVVGYTKV
jgi:hypothetical protein